MSILKKAGIFLLNAMFICLHLFALWVIEAMFFGKLLSLSKGMEWAVWMDVVIYVISIAILALHYLLLYIGQRRNLIFKWAVTVMSVMEIMLACIVFYLFLSEIISVSYDEAIFYFAIQLIIVCCGSLYSRFCNPSNVGSIMKIAE